MTAEGERIEKKRKIGQKIHCMGQGWEFCVKLKDERDRMKRALEVAVNCLKNKLHGERITVYNEESQSNCYKTTKRTLAEISKIMGEKS